MLAAFHLVFFADASAASNAMRTYLTPVMGTLIALASLAVVFFLVNGGYQYMTSAGNVERLDHAKKVIRNALIGLVMVIAAITLTAILSHAYGPSHGEVTQKLPALIVIQPAPTDGVVNLFISAVTGMLSTIVETMGKPFMAALSFFTTATPLMADNSGVFNLWLVILGIADVLFILIVALLGFHVMSFATFGLEEIEFKHLLPRIALAFLLMNTSIFAIDAVISLSNGMISALNAGFNGTSVWDVLTAVVELSGNLGLAPLLIMVVFMILSVMLLVYYVLRLVVLYIGAVLSPIAFLIWLLPSFKDFAASAMKTYVTTIFVLFIHVVILQLAATLFAGMVIATPGQAFNPLMSMIVGIATLFALLKTQSVLSQLSYASLGPKTASRLGGQLVHAIRQYSGGRKKGAVGDDGKRPEGLSRGGKSTDNGGRKGMFYKSNSVVIPRHKPGRRPGVTTIEMSPATATTQPPQKSKRAPGNMREAPPNIGKDKT